MSSVPAAPRNRTAFASTTLATARVQATSSTNSAVALLYIHYLTTIRHSLYGMEDRVVIDSGSQIWKVGRASHETCFMVQETAGRHSANSHGPQTQGAEEDKLEARL